MPRDHQVGSFTVGGLRYSSVDRVKAIDLFFQLSDTKSGGAITSIDAHGIVLSQSDQHLREIINHARMNLPDGMPVEWLGRWKGAHVRRVHGHDFFEGVLRDARAAKIRHYFYGGQPTVLANIVARSNQLIGVGAIAGFHSPPLRSIGAMEDPSVIARIAATEPDVIWVGLGLPKQEYWIANHSKHFPGVIFVAIGAAFDYFAGVHMRAPKLMQKVGLEWSFRVLSEPKRLWPRYRRVVPRMLLIMGREVFRHQP